MILFIETLLTMSQSASFVIIAVYIFRFFLKNTPKIYTHALWFLVLFRLLCPISLESPFSLMPESTVSFQEITQILPDITTPEATSFSQNKVPTFPDPQTEVPEQINQPELVISEEIPNISPEFKQNSSHIITIIWFVGFTLLFFSGLLSYFTLEKQLKHSSRQGKNLYTNITLQTAVLVGFFPAKIYLPPKMLKNPYVLCHEETHKRRGDHIFRLFSYLALSIHWFNPLVWCFYLTAEKDMELSCDQAVLKKLGNKSTYAQLLLDNAQTQTLGSLITPLAFSQGDTKERIFHIMTYKQPKFWAILFATTCSICAVSAFAFDQPPKYKNLTASLYVSPEPIDPNPITLEEVHNLYPFYGAFSEAIFQNVFPSATDIIYSHREDNPDTDEFAILFHWNDKEFLLGISHQISPKESQSSYNYYNDLSQLGQADNLNLIFLSPIENADPYNLYSLGNCEGPQTTTYFLNEDNEVDSIIEETPLALGNIGYDTTIFMPYSKDETLQAHISGQGYDWSEEFPYYSINLACYDEMGVNEIARLHSDIGAIFMKLKNPTWEDTRILDNPPLPIEESTFQLNPTLINYVSLYNNDYSRILFGIHDPELMTEVIDIIQNYSYQTLAQPILGVPVPNENERAFYFEYHTTENLTHTIYLCDNGFIKIDWLTYYMGEDAKSLITDLMHFSEL